jgi:hypothetical protein
LPTAELVAGNRQAVAGHCASTEEDLGGDPADDLLSQVETFLREALIRTSATPAVSMRSKSTSALEERGFRGLKFISGVTDTMAVALPKPVLRVP